MPNLSADEIQRQLDNFPPTDRFYAVYPFVYITEGVKWLAEVTDSFWLISWIWACQALPQLCRMPSQRYRLQVDRETHTIHLQCLGKGQQVILTQTLHSMEFPLDSLRLWFHNGVLMLLSEID